MKNFIRSKLFIALSFFCLGILFNHFSTKLTFNSKNVDHLEERFPVDPHDFDQSKMMDAVEKMQQDFFSDSSSLGGHIAGIERSEDSNNVYYIIPLSENEKNRELKVNIKDGLISITENTKNTQSQREFSLEPGLDETRAEIINDQDKIKITLPKKNKEHSR